MARKPINAEVPAAQSKPTSAERSKAPPPKRQRQRKPIPAALKGIAALVIVAVVFILAAILGGRGGEQESSTTPAPTPVATENAGESDASHTAEQLGYPAFATNNTTRIGSSDAASNAAAVALAVYPSTVDTLRPDAVTFGDGESWHATVAAAVLMAKPLGAPLLVSGPSGSPETTSQALDVLDPQGRKRTRGAQDVAIGPAGGPGAHPPRSSWRRRAIRASPTLPRPGRLVPEARSSLPNERHCRRRPPRSSKAIPTCPSTCSVPRRRSPPRWCARSPKSAVRCTASPARILSPPRSPSPATPTAGSVGTSTPPGTASSSPAPMPRSTRRWQRRSPVRALGVRCCSATAPLRCRRRCATTCSTSSRATVMTRRAPSTTTFG